MHHSINDGVYCYHSWTANWNRTVGRWKPDVHIIFRYSHPGPATMVGRIMFFWHGHGIAKFLNASIVNDFQGRVTSQDFREGILSGRSKNAHTHTWLVTGSSVFLRWGLLSKRYRQRTEWSYHGDSDFLSRRTSQASAETAVIISKCPSSWGESISLNVFEPLKNHMYSVMLYIHVV